jgi:pimeloyl-ACP methyl ester carboxylesterase
MDTPGPAPVAVHHRRVDVGGIDTFYREAGPPGGPVMLLPHGYPSSSYQYRRLLPALGDRWRLIAPDQPGFGHTATPDPADFAYTFDAHAGFLGAFADRLGLDRYALYLFDYGSQFGLRLAMQRPERVAALVIQNGDIYEDELGPRYKPLRDFWDHPTPEGRDELAANVSQAGFRDEFVNGAGDRTDRLSPDLWTLHWALMDTPARRAAVLRLFEDQATTLADFPRQQAYLREHRPPTLIVWGPDDGYMPAGAARAYRRDLPDAELHLLDGGHWLLETHPDEVAWLVRDFLSRKHTSA